MAVAAAEPPAEEINANDAKSDQTSTTSTTSDADGTSPPINAKDADTLSLSSSTSSTTKKLRFPRTRRILTVLFGSANKPRHLSLREQGDMDHPDLWGHESGGGRELVAPGSGSLGGLLGRQGRDGESNLASSSSSSGSKSPFDSSSQTDDEDEEEESDGPEELDDFDISHSEQTKDLDNDIGEEMSPIVERVKPAEITVQERAREKAEEYERNCGELFRDYRSCLQVSDCLLDGDIVLPMLPRVTR